MVLAAPVEVLVLALVAAVSFGLGPVFSKRGLADGGNWRQNTVVVLGTRAAFFWAVLLVMADLSAFDGVTTAVAGIFAAAGVAIGVGRFMFYKGVDDVGSTIANAFVNTRPLFAVLLAILWLGETVTPRMSVGVVVLVVGLATLTVSKGGDIEGWVRADLVLPLLAAALFALGNVFRRFGFTSSPIGTLQAVAIGDLVGFLFVLAATGVVGNRRDLRPSRTTLRNFVLAGACGTVGIFLLFEAFSLEGGTVSVVDPLSATAPLFTTVFAVALLRDVERVTPGTVVGIVVVIAGVGLITLG